jgi:glutathione S-transferase
VELDDGHYIAQFNTIIRYLARGSSLLPEDVYQQAKIDEWLLWEQYSHEPYVAVCRSQMRYQNRTKHERDQWRVERAERALNLMDSHLTECHWLAGNAPTIADIALLAYTRLTSQGGFDLAAREHVSKWVLRCEKQLAIRDYQTLT